MNPFLVIILIAILFEYAINLVASLLNLKNLNLEIPGGLEGLYKPEEYCNSQRYTRTFTRFNFVTSTFSLTLLLVFWFTGSTAGRVLPGSMPCCT